MDTRFLSKVKRRDRLARWFIISGGIGIIASMMVMIFFMIKVTLPLFSDASRELMLKVSHQELEKPVIYDIDPYLEQVFAIDEQGKLTVFELKDSGSILSTRQLKPPAPATAENPEEESANQVSETATLDQESEAQPSTILRAEKHGKHHFVLYWSNGGVSTLESEFKVSFDETTNERKLEHHIETVASQPPGGMGRPEALSQFRLDEEGSTTLVRQLSENEVYVARVKREEDLFGDVTITTSETTVQTNGNAAINALRLTENGRWLYLGTSVGTLLLYDLEEIDQLQQIASVQATTSGSPITAMNFPFGESSLAVGDQKGEVSIWSLIRYEDGPKLKKLHSFKHHQEAIVQIQPSLRDKALVTQDASGGLHLFHMTSERNLLTFEPDLDIQGFALSERFDAMLLRDKENSFWFWAMNVPHPEISFKTLWKEVWYEGYQKPEYAWQSSSASDDFEPKLSLMPLLFGSLKGTFYGMLFSLPLALLCAMYVSHLMEPRWRVIIKPVVELMAAIPTVVIGFLAALWLAPKIEANLLAVVFSLVVIPMFIFAAMWFFIKRKRKLGAEFLIAIPFVIAGFYVAYQVGLVIQDTTFGGNINLWLFQQMGLSVDQRNCVVISFALGFAVIPIIFTISEDALYNVPKHLTAAALALGSSRWQTLRRVVLPMASPGIFAATMIGFGRAVGETMIVLMATGNTPIMSPSILNGMRTLSANIAVEIPEAPVGSSLYRLLFLSAVLLFMLTFVVNTLAEVVRHRLQQKYKNL